MSIAIANSLKKVFLPWNQLPLPSAAQWLAETRGRPGHLDMSDCVVVVPTARSQRRLLELLLEISEREEQIFVPPEITTLGTFPERLYHPQKPLASSLVQTIAWIDALHRTPAPLLKNFARVVPDQNDALGWLMLAEIVSKWAMELAGVGLTFNDILKTGQKLENFREPKRWQTLVEVQHRYWDFLKEKNLWDRQNARLMAIKNEECQTDKDVFLVGTVDLNPTFRQMIRQIAAQTTVLVFAESDDHEKFDDFGCLQLSAWESMQVSFDDDQVVIGNQPIDQARWVADFLHDLNGEYGIDQVAITAPDQDLVPLINRTLTTFDVKTHDVGGSSVSNSRVFVLLELLSDWIGDERFESFAAFVRHPDIYTWVTQRIGNDHWLNELDEYQNNRLPFYISSDVSRVYFQGKDFRGRRKYANLDLAYHELYELIQPLLTNDPKPLDHWGEPWRQILVAVYRDTQLDRNEPENRRTIRSCQKMVQALVELDDVGKLLPHAVSAVDALQIALRRCSDDFVADPAIPDAISVIGWLDTVWEDTPVTVITSFNEGYIPSSDASSLFLPNSIRSQLGLLDNRRRYARDVYALRLILASRQKLRLIVGRRDAEGQPLLPSRLLMTGEPKQVAARALRLFKDGKDTRQWQLGAPTQRPTTQQFTIPDPTIGQPTLESLRVTDFSQFLSCPYRFYLSRVLGLNKLNDRQNELDPAQFGSLIHDVVETFGKSDTKDSKDVKQIDDFVQDCLNRFALSRYGTRPVPTVNIQLAQARLRLRAFANWQVSHRNKGFEIFEVERPKTRHVFDLDGHPFEIRGQIDRIDINFQTKVIGLYDYKTGTKKPREAHLKYNEWINLQLPLYRHLLNQFDDLPLDPHDPETRVETGYILINQDTNSVGLYEAGWSQSELLSADAKAFEIMRTVRRNDFWPPSPESSWWDDYGAICQAHVFDRWQRPQDGNSNTDEAEHHS